MKIFRAVFECTAPLHCGGGADSLLDQPVSRDAFDLWHIPASSFAGALRSLGVKIDPLLTERIFGDQTGDESVPSLIWCDDILLLDLDSRPALGKILAGQKPLLQCRSFVRDHVRIDLESGAGVEGGKFDMEIVPPGTRFLLQTRCDGWNRELTWAENEYFERLCALVLSGALELGGKTGLDYGRYKILRHEYRDLPLASAEGMTEWLNLDEFALPGAQSGLQAAEPAPAPNNLDGWLEIPLACAGPVLIGGGEPDKTRLRSEEADMLFALTPRLKYPPLTENPADYARDAQSGAECIEWLPVLPASSLRGVLRHALYDIMASLNIGPEISNAILADIFGTVSTGASRCGKISVSDAPLNAASGNDNFAFVQHVALDRFSAAPIDGALFSEEPFWVENAAAAVKISVHNLEAHEAALLFHALLDLFEGSLAAGSGVNRGNGFLKLPGWHEDRQKAFAAIRGSMSWNGENILQNGIPGLLRYAAQWDAALKERVAL